GGGTQTGLLLPEQQHAGDREAVAFQGHRAGDVVHPDDGQILLAGPGEQVFGGGVMVNVLVAVGDHRTAAVPAAPTHDMHRSRPEGVRAAHHRADVEVPAPV